LQNSKTYLFFELQYKDDENDKVTLTCDADLLAAVLHAKSAGAKVWIMAFFFVGFWMSLAQGHS